MKTGRKLSTFLCAAGMSFCLLAAPLQATVIVDDSFADGDLAKTGALDTSWWTSSSSSGVEIAPGELGFVTGSSGRGIHTTFPVQTIANVGDRVKATYTFTTPATVGNNRSTAFRVGLFDTLGRLTDNFPGTDPNDVRTDLCCLDANVNASSGSPNAAFGHGFLVGGPGTESIPGYMFDMDVNTGITADLNIREHNRSSPTGTGTGRLMGTTSNFSSVQSSGPDAGYTFDPNTQYTGMFEILRLNATQVRITGTLDGLTHTVVDDFESDSFDMLGFHANSNTFGSTSSQGEADNGIDFSNITVEFLPVPEPTSATLVLGAVALLAGIRGRR